MKRSSAFVLRRIGSDTLLVPIGAQVGNTNGVIVVNDVTSFVWDLLAEDRSLDALVLAVGETFAVENDRAREDLRVLLDDLICMGVVDE